jgi:hypothetical protein
MRKDEHNLADVNVLGALLVLATGAVVFVTGFLIATCLPEEWTRHARPVKLGIPAVVVGLCFFGACRAVLEKFGFSILRRPGEPKVVAISIGILLCIGGIAVSAVTFIKFFMSKRPPEGITLLGIGGGGLVLVLAGALAIRNALKSQRDERMNDPWDSHPSPE